MSDYKQLLLSASKFFFLYIFVLRMLCNYVSPSKFRMLGKQAKVCEIKELFQGSS